MPFAVVIFGVCGGKPVVGRGFFCIVPLCVVGSHIRENAYFLTRVFALEGNAVNAVCLRAHTLAVNYRKFRVFLFGCRFYSAAAVYTLVCNIFNLEYFGVCAAAIVLPVKRHIVFGVFNFKIVVFGVFKQCKRNTFKRCAAFRYI